MPDGSSEEPGSFCSFQDSQTAPERRKWRRIHGLQPPLHPQQAAGWLAIVAFAVACFAFLVPALAGSLRSPVLFTFVGLFAFHIVSHLTALLLDPAEDELRKIGSHRVVPEFDRGKHAHVIENGRCHLCNILTSGPRTKHCSVCNKCVRRFDHHCKWLNHCVGGRNYVAFFMCVVSAVTAALAVLAVALAELVLYYVEPEWLSPWESVYGFNDTMANATSPENEITKALAMQDTIFLLIVGILGLLAAVTAGLLLHLCFFHVYISFLGLTTYEYIRNYRQQTMSTGPPAAPEQQPEDAVKNKVYICSNVRSTNRDSELRHRPSSLYCCNTSSEYYEHTHNTYYFCSVLDEAGPPAGDVFAAKTFQCCAETRHYRPDPRQSNLDIEQVKTVSQGCTVCTVKTRKQVSENGAKSCVMKTINKHHRWKRKWNCCSTVPESPVTPENNINSILSGENGIHSNCNQTSNDAIAVISGGLEYQDLTNAGNVSKGDADSESSSRDQGERSFSRPWSMIHFRRMYRALNRMGVRRQRKRVSKQFPVRGNQVGPIATVHITDNDKENLSEQFLERLRGDPVVTKLPSLPPPVRRKIKNVTDLQELADSLATAQIQQTGPMWRGSGIPPAGYRRGRRKNLHSRPRSPTLSPIRESGLSNPASPQPCRAALALCPTRPSLPPDTSNIDKDTNNVKC